MIILEVQLLWYSRVCEGSGMIILEVVLGALDDPRRNSRYFELTYEIGSWLLLIAASSGCGLWSKSSI